MNARYSIDTSALLDAWVRWYPPDIFLGLWDKLDVLATTGILVASEEVENEFERKSDDVLEWIKRRPAMIIPHDEPIQHHARVILKDFQKMVDERSGKSMADPFVIALAKVCDLTVVTGEKGGTPRRPKIPSVCDHYGIRCIGITELIRECEWTF